MLPKLTDCCVSTKTSHLWSTPTSADPIHQYSIVTSLNKAHVLNGTHHVLYYRATSNMWAQKYTKARTIFSNYLQIVTIQIDFIVIFVRCGIQCSVRRSAHNQWKAKINFDNVISNVGNSYDSNTGIFIVPHNGTYDLTLRNMGRWTQVFTHIMRNEEILCTAYGVGTMGKVIMHLKLWNTQGTRATNPIQRWLQIWIQVSPLIELYLRLDFLKFFGVYWHFFTTMFHVDTMSTIASCEFTFTAYVHLLPQHAKTLSANRTGIFTSHHIFSDIQFIDTFF